MTAKFSASADGTKVYLGNASENALELDATAKLIKAVAPYAFSLPARVYAPGEIIQQVIASDGGVTGFGNSGFVSVTQSAKTITPKSTNSVILLQVFAQVIVNNVTGVNAAVNLQMWNYRESAGGPIFSFGALSSSGGIGWHGTASVELGLANNSLTPINCALFGQAVGAGASISIVAQRYVLTEIQN